MIAHDAPDTPDVEAEFFPPSLRGLGILAADMRDLKLPDGRRVGDGRDGACFKLIAGLLGVGLDEVRQREAQRARDAARRNFMLAVGGVVLSIVAVIAAIGAFVSAIEAEDRANLALMTESEYLARASDVALAQRNPTLALLLALEGSPASRTRPDRPYSVAIEGALMRALRAQAQIAEIPVQGVVRALEITNTAAFVMVSANPDIEMEESPAFGVRGYDFRDGREIGFIPLGARGGFATSPDGRDLLVYNNDGARLVEAGDMTLRWSRDHVRAAIGAVWSEDSTRAFVGFDDGSLLIVDRARPDRSRWLQGTISANNGWPSDTRAVSLGANESVVAVVGAMGVNFWAWREQRLLRYESDVSLALMHRSADTALMLRDTDRALLSLNLGTGAAIEMRWSEGGGFDGVQDALVTRSGDAVIVGTPSCGSGGCWATPSDVFRATTTGFADTRQIDDHQFTTEQVAALPWQLDSYLLTLGGDHVIMGRAVREDGVERVNFNWRPHDRGTQRFAVSRDGSLLATLGTDADDNPSERAPLSLRIWRGEQVLQRASHDEYYVEGEVDSVRWDLDEDRYLVLSGERLSLHVSGRAALSVALPISDANLWGWTDDVVLISGDNQTLLLSLNDLTVLERFDVELYGLSYGVAPSQRHVLNLSPINDRYIWARSPEGFVRVDLQERRLIGPFATPVVPTVSHASNEFLYFWADSDEQGGEAGLYIVSSHGAQRMAGDVAIAGVSFRGLHPLIMSNDGTIGAAQGSIHRTLTRGPEGVNVTREQGREDEQLALFGWNQMALLCDAEGESYFQAARRDDWRRLEIEFSCNGVDIAANGRRALLVSGATNGEEMALLLDENGQTIAQLVANDFFGFSRAGDLIFAYRWREARETAQQTTEIVAYDARTGREMFAAGNGGRWMRGIYESGAVVNWIAHFNNGQFVLPARCEALLERAARAREDLRELTPHELGEHLSGGEPQSRGNSIYALFRWLAQPFVPERGDACGRFI